MSLEATRAYYQKYGTAPRIIGPNDEWPPEATHCLLCGVQFMDDYIHPMYCAICVEKPAKPYVVLMAVVLDAVSGWKAEQTVQAALVAALPQWRDVLAVASMPEDQSAHPFVAAVVQELVDIASRQGGYVDAEGAEGPPSKYYNRDTNPDWV